MSERVLFIDETAQVGGAEVNLLTLAARLQARGWEVRVVLPEQGPLSEKLAAADVPVDYVPGVPDKSLSFHVGSLKLPDPLAWLVDMWKSLTWVAGLRRYLRANEPPLVHTMSFWAHVCGGAAARLAGVPVVSHFQELVGVTSALGLYRRLIHAWARWVPDHIVCISPKVAEQFDRLPRLRAKTSVILNTVDVEEFAPVPEVNEETYGKDGLRIGTVARLIPWKGQHVALEAAGMMKGKIDFEWLFVGGASLGSSAYAQRVKNQAQRLGLEKHVEFVDWIEDMPDFYRSLDVLVHVPTEPEPFGLVLGEAMACGVPVVTTAGGGAEELVRAGQGLVVPPGDAEVVASSLLGLGESPEDRQARGREARGLAAQTFSVPQYVSQWLEVYQSVKEGASL